MLRKAHKVDGFRVSCEPSTGAYSSPALFVAFPRKVSHMSYTPGVSYSQDGNCSVPKKEKRWSSNQHHFSRGYVVFKGRIRRGDLQGSFLIVWGCPPPSSWLDKRIGTGISSWYVKYCSHEIHCSKLIKIAMEHPPFWWYLSGKMGNFPWLR